MTQYQIRETTLACKTMQIVQNAKEHTDILIFVVRQENVFLLVDAKPKTVVFDNWCQSTFGTCSECVPLEGDGACSPIAYGVNLIYSSHISIL